MSTVTFYCGGWNLHFSGFFITTFLLTNIFNYCCFSFCLVIKFMIISVNSRKVRSFGKATQVVKNSQIIML